MAITLGLILRGTDLIAANGLDAVISGVEYDSRQVKPGSVFLCIRGFHVDGHTFIGDAISHGAAAVIIDRSIPLPPGIPWAKVRNSRIAMGEIAANYYDYPSRKMTMIGVTGTNGKTTIANLIDFILRIKGTKTGVIGTIWNKVDGRKLPALHTTPEASDLQELLSEMVAASVEAVSMEVSSHALALARVNECEFDVGVFSNLTRDHLDFHKSMDEYLAAKMLLFTRLGRERTKNRPCYGVVNLDDPAGATILNKMTAPAVTYGIRERADLQATDLELQTSGSKFKLCYKGKKVPFTIALPGEYNIYNALAAIAVGLQEGIDLMLLQEAVSRFRGLPGRFETVDYGQDFTVIVDYAHTPDALQNVLKTARTITKGRLITVFGCTGERDAGKRPIMGRIAGEMSEHTIITSDDPYTEDPGQIARQVEEGIRNVPDARYQLIIDREEGIRQALLMARPGDLVMIAGKGHETYQIIDTKKIPFDDHKVVRDILDKERIG